MLVNLRNPDRGDRRADYAGPRMGRQCERIPVGRGPVGVFRPPLPTYIYSPLSSKVADPHPIPLPQAGEGTRPSSLKNRVPSPTTWERVRVRECQMTAIPNTRTCP